MILILEFKIQSNLLECIIIFSFRISYPDFEELNAESFPEMD